MFAQISLDLLRMIDKKVKLKDKHIPEGKTSEDFTGVVYDTLKTLTGELAYCRPTDLYKIKWNCGKEGICSIKDIEIL